MHDLKILNLGCGTRTSDRAVNIDWSVFLRIKKSRLLTNLTPLLLKGQRLERFRQMSGEILLYDLRRGIPFPEGSVDVVYSSHLLEHIGRSSVGSFITEIRRVLKPGGTVRTVVPDLEQLCRGYLSHVETCESDPTQIPFHDVYISEIIEQCVRDEAVGTRKQGRVRRILENLLFGSPNQRGQTHRWMYDRFNIEDLFREYGFRRFSVQRYDTSEVSSWNETLLDMDADGREYKTGSLYFECVK